MEYELKNLPVSKGRLTIGFLDEDAYDEYHNQIVQGICKAAQKHNINIIRFGHFAVNIISRNTSHEDVLLEYVKQLKLDGLIYLAWARATSNKAFKRIFENVPLLNLGSYAEDIPSIFFSGETYVREILVHLINVHKLRNIAFIAPFHTDERINVYTETMKLYNFYNPQLYISDEDLKNLDINERGKRAVEILIDERKVKFDAIVSLYTDQTYEVMKELRARGVHVPGDVAVTSYEDGESGRFSAPAYTTVYFPWKEMGYYACEVMVKLLTEGHVPMRTEVPGRVIYRDSCGCVPDSATDIHTGPVHEASVSFGELNEEELAGISEKLAEATVFCSEEMQIIMEKFKQAFMNGSSQSFLMEFEIQLRKMNYYSGNKLNRVAVDFRRILLPYFLPYSHISMEKLVWAENIFYQMQIILQNKLTNSWFREDANYKNAYITLKEIGQILITNFIVKNLMDSLETNLPRLKVQGCYLYIFGNIDNNKRFDNYHLELEYRGGKRIISSDVQNKNAPHNFKEVLFKEDRNYFISAHLLYVGNDFIGFVLFEPALMDLRLYYSLGIQISTALNEAMLFEKLDASYRRLMELAHKKGMADISTGILHNIANILSSVNVTAQSLHTLLGDSAIDDLLMANSMLEKRFDDLEEFIRNDPKGKLLMQFYVSLGDSFTNFRSKFQSDIGRLTDKINLIDEIVTAQQSYAGIKTSLKSLDVIPVVEDVLKMHQAFIEKHHVKVIRSYGRTAMVQAQRTKLFHILTNLIKNAIESMENEAVDFRSLTIAITGDGKNLFIRVSDTGGGIAQEYLDSIFAYGFTTKKDGHGFGLHSCANYMTEMNGRIWAENSENDKGATFILQLKMPE